MKEAKIDLSLENKLFARLVGEQDPNKANQWSNLTLNNFPLDFQRIYKVFYSELNSSAEFDSGGQQLISIHFNEQGSLRDLYPPAIYKARENTEGILFVLRWGAEEFPIHLNEKDQLEIAGSNKIKITIGDEVVGRWERCCFLGTLVDKESKTVYKLPFPLKLYKPSEDTVLLKTADVNSYMNAEMVDLVLDQVKLIPDGNAGGDTVSYFKNLPEGDLVEFVSTEPFSKKDGTPGLFLISSKGEKYFCPDRDKFQIDSGAVVSIEYPYQVTRQVQDGKNRYTKKFGKWEPQEDVLNITF